MLASPVWIALGLVLQKGTDAGTGAVAVGDEHPSKETLKTPSTAVANTVRVMDIGLTHYQIGGDWPHTNCD